MTDYRGGGLCALVEHRLGRRQRTVSAELIEALLRLLERTPQSLGYLRSTWSSKSMAMALNSHQGLASALAGARADAIARVLSSRRG
ncbi:MAG: hypothetical protein CMQ61_13590, partial [Gammaproteobacteria bacterium]|nr:hypothetical protein [Gammaproteobacteria bacterium]